LFKTVKLKYQSEYQIMMWCSKISAISIMELMK
jgi:hypothetical protein